MSFLASGSASQGRPGMPAWSCSAGSRGIRRRISGSPWGRSGSEARACPGAREDLGRDGSCRSTSTSSAATPTPSSWRCPEALAAEVAPALADRGARVFDLSGAFRLRDPEFRQRWYPHSPAVDVPLTYGLTERYREDLPRRAAHRVRRLLPDRRGAGAAAAGRGRACSSRASSSTPSPASRAPARRRPSARTSPSATAASRRTASSRTAMPPRSSRSSACR